MMAFEAKILTLFPEAFPGTLGLSVIGQALKKKKWKLTAVDIRRFGEGKHRKVDSTPSGGGPGMVMRADVLAKAIDSIHPRKKAGRPLVYLSPRGKPFTQAMAATWAKGKGLTLVCGRFEGVDERLLDARGIEEISVGDYVLSGGEAAALVVLEAVLRLIPGVVGKAESLKEESFSAGLLEYPQYTRPHVWEGREIPEILVSGHHGKIKAWRKLKAEELTRKRRPDLLKGSPARGPTSKR
ncbi:MAG TPA: tRNA (guanosine(37)-N1)-methyltransferase TrmD [Sphingomonadales bacterium]|nr:tRNA (guanosine(37)-N1)-methyltransferase TrmD [Sphingomonadales bacterium]